MNFSIGFFFFDIGQDDGADASKTNQRMFGTVDGQARAEWWGTVQVAVRFSLNADTRRDIKKRNGKKKEKKTTVNAVSAIRRSAMSGAPPLKRKELIRLRWLNDRSLPIFYYKINEGLTGVMGRWLCVPFWANTSDAQSQTA